MQTSKWLIMLLGIGIVLSACTSSTRALEGNAKDAVLAYAEPMATTLLDGLFAGNYTTFATNFDEAMRKGLDEKAFTDLRSTLQTRLGAFQSREVNAVLESGNYFIVVYRLRFEKDDNVTMRLVLTQAEPHLISGLWFDSPELRKR
ncbi:DUF3887 domain-containing protein [uncultured Thermanaerothrix sp.]|uniref:DUF3887 domain-containing protein n=1 Tax=uncultured Thermanaerothrix sp. TaxID=1195149 RepID=UPI002612A9C5|nr:DUF3887 domain-containing protein [uncultured Thermanaerothrix sp.]